LVFIGEGPQLGVGEVDEVLFDGVDLVRDAVQLAQDLAFACTHDLREDGHGGWSPCRSGLGRSDSFDLLSNGHRMRGPHRVGRPAHPLQGAQRPGPADGAAYRRRIARNVITRSRTAKGWRAWRAPEQNRPM